MDPSQVAGMPALGGDNDETPVIRHIDQRRSSPLPAPGPDMVEQQQRRMARQVMADPGPRLRRSPDHRRPRGMAARMCFSRRHPAVTSGPVYSGSRMA